MAKFQKNMTQGSVTRHLLLFSLPFFASSLLQALYNVTDILIVGQICGPIGTSAVGTGGQVIILIINLINGLAFGGTVLIAQFIGAQQQENVKRTVGTLFSMYGITALVMTIGMLLCNRWILVALSMPTESFDEALSYLNICMGGTIFVFGYNAVSAVLRGMGDSRHPFIFVSIASVMNIILDIVFVGPLNMGPAGAAWATIIAQGFSFILSIVFLKSNNFIFDFHPRSFHIDKKLALQLLKIGLPLSLQGTLVTFSFMWLTRLGNDIAGLVGSNALSIAGKVDSIAILPSLAMQASISSISGQNLGAGKPERAKKTMLIGMAITFVFSAFVLAMISMFSRQIVSIFIGSRNSSLSIDIINQCIVDGSIYLKCISLDYPIVCIVFCINGLAMGAGQTMFSLFNALVSSILLRIPVAWILGVGFKMGLPGVGLSVPIAAVGSLVIGIIYLSTGRWRKNIL